MAKTITEGGPVFPIGRRLKCINCHHEWEIEEEDLEKPGRLGPFNRAVDYYTRGIIGGPRVVMDCPKCGHGNSLTEYSRPKHWSSQSRIHARPNMELPEVTDTTFSLQLVLGDQVIGYWVGTGEEYDKFVEALQS